MYHAGYASLKEIIKRKLKYDCAGRKRLLNNNTVGKILDIIGKATIILGIISGLIMGVMYETSVMAIITVI